MAKWIRKGFSKAKEQRKNIQPQNIRGHRGTAYQLQEHAALEDQAQLLESASCNSQGLHLQSIYSPFLALQTLHTCARTHTQIYNTYMHN